MGKPSVLTHESSFHLIILTKTTDLFYIENETIISQTKIQTLFEIFSVYTDDSCPNYFALHTF